MQRLQKGVSEIESRLAAMEATGSEFREFVRNALSEILIEAKRTNGRVGELERFRAGHEEWTEQKRRQLERLMQDVEELKRRVWIATGAASVIGVFIGRMWK